MKQTETVERVGLWTPHPPIWKHKMLFHIFSLSLTEFKEFVLGPAEG